MSSTTTPDASRFTAHPQFEHLATHELPEYRARGLLLRHRKTGCQVYHIVNDDIENLFAFALKTLPADSSGVAHILEHTVLCGSQAFPLKDPFLLLLKGSMSTFLNAFTFPDKTVYPASSTVEKDLFNIMRVYGDAVFFPLLKRHMFQQEGYRLQLDEHGKLALTGVVFNEMKGAYATHDAIASEWAYRSLFPDTPYANDSGGDPQHIPDLTYEQFLEFHRRHYHPSNTRVFLYGNIATGRYLDFLHHNFLDRFERLEVAFTVPRQPRWDRPRTLQRTFPVDSAAACERQASVTLNWLLCPVTDQHNVLALEILSEILLGHSGAPLQKVIVESELGEDLSAPTGLETELLELVFSAGMRGTDARHRRAIETLIIGELERLRDSGIPADIRTGALRRVEFRNREIRGGGPFGLRLMRKALRGWLHDGTPDVTLRFNDTFQRLTAAIDADPRYFEGLIDRYLLGNRHRTTLVVTPDEQHAEREQRAFSERLHAVEQTLDQAARREIEADQRRLLEYQSAADSPQDLARIPFLQRSDVPSRVETIDFRTFSTSGVDVYRHDLFTNGIAYIDLAFALDDLPAELLPLVPFFTSVLTECGLSGVGYDELSTQLALHTGGFSVRAEVGCHADNPERVVPLLFMRLKSLESALPQAVDLVVQIMLDADFGNARRIHDVLTEARNDMRSSIIPAGHMYSMTRAAAALSPTAAVEERWKGVSQLLFLSEHCVDGGAERLGAALRKLRDHVINRARLKVGFTCDPASGVPVQQQVERLAAALPAGPKIGEQHAFSGSLQQRPRVESLLVPTQVNYVARAMAGSPIGTTEQTAEVLLGHLMSTGYLWERIRMKGGAYGAFSSSRGAEQVFVFGSYRDPNITATLDAFHAALHHFSAAPVDERSLDLAVLGTVGGELRPLAPAERGLVSFRRILYRVSDQIRQAKRDAMLSMTPQQLQRAAERLLVHEQSAAVVVIGGRKAVADAAATLPELMLHVMEIAV
ncbi:MAG: peptidase M16 [Spirochaetaceae bacterium]|nr:MAG: peptidase M16 [Spirochaetaceae bacterium]